VVRRARVALLAAVAVAVVGGCGGDDGRPGASPATAAPPSALAYAEVEIKPPGARGRAASAGLRRLAGGPRGTARLEQAFTRRAAGATLEGDVLPWLGRRAGAFVAPGGGLVLVVPTPDPDTARGNLEDAVLAAGGRRVEYRGASLTVRGHRAVTVRRGVALAGNAAGVRAAVRALGAGPSLAEHPGFRAATARLAPRRVATAWVARGRARDVAARVGGAAAADLALRVLDLNGRRPLVAGVVLDRERLTAEVPGARGERLEAAFGLAAPALRPLAAGVAVTLGSTSGGIGRLVLALR
jgi:hypothetical protein